VAEMAAIRICALVPSFDNPRTVGRVVRELRKHLDTVIVVDDGSGDEGRQTLVALAHEPTIRHPRRYPNCDHPYAPYNGAANDRHGRHRILRSM